MQTNQTDPNATLNGPQPAESQGFLATVKSYCILRNGVIATAVALLGTAVYCYVTSDTDVPTA